MLRGHKILLSNGLLMTHPAQLEELVRQHPAKVDKLLYQDDLLQALRVIVHEYQSDYDILQESVNLGMILNDFADLIGLDAIQKALVFGQDCDRLQAELQTGYRLLEPIAG